MASINTNITALNSQKIISDQKSIAKEEVAEKENQQISN